MSLPRLSYKRHRRFLFAHSPSFSLFLIICCGGSQLATPGQHSGEAHMLRNQGLLPTASEDLRKPHQQPCEWTTLDTDSPLSLQMTTMQVDILTATSRDTLNPNHSAKFPPDSWPSETVWDSKFLVLVKVLNLGAICYTAVDNYYNHHWHHVFTEFL